MLTIYLAGGSLALLGLLLVKSAGEKTLISTSKENAKLKSILAGHRYHPTFFLFTPLLQIAFHQLTKRDLVVIKRELFRLKCGGVVGLDHAVFSTNIASRIIRSSKNPNKKSVYNSDINNSGDPGQQIMITDSSKDVPLLSPIKILVIMHGVLGGSNSPQIKDLIDYYSTSDNKFFNQVISIQSRGINDTPLSTPKSYHAGSYEDIKETLEYIIKSNTNCEIYLIGISLGACLLTNLLARFEFPNVKAFVSISNPFHLMKSINNAGGLTKRFFLYKIKQRIQNNPVLLTQFDSNSMNEWNCIKEFERDFTIKVHKELYTSVEDYYSVNSCDNKIKDLKVHSLFINSKDDDLAPLQDLDKSQCKQ